MTNTPAIQIMDLHKRYGNGFDALKGINLTVNPGDFYALLGPNGAGKSTTIGMLTSLVTITSGEILINGFAFKQNLSKAKALMGVVPQEINVNSFEKCEQILLQQAMYYGVSIKKAKPRVEALLKQLELWEKRNTPAGKLSGGMKRRLMIARALVHDPKILILDEPTAGVDVEIRQSMWHFLQDLNQKGLTIVLTTHYLEEAESLCNRIGIINHGKLVIETTMRQLLSQLERETLLFDLAKSRNTAPTLKGFPTRLRSADVLEVDIQRGQELNCVFRQLNDKNIDVLSVRNKANRLEQLFMELVRHGEQA